MFSYVIIHRILTNQSKAPRALSLAVSKGNFDSFKLVSYEHNKGRTQCSFTSAMNAIGGYSNTCWNSFKRGGKKCIRTYNIALHT